MPFLSDGEEPLSIPRPFTKNRMNYKGITIFDVFFVVSVVGTIGAIVYATVGISLTTGIMLGIIILILVIGILPMWTLDKYKLYQLIWRKIVFASSIKKFGTKTNPIENCFPFSKVEDFLAADASSKHFFGVIELDGVDLPLYSFADQDSKMYALDEMLQKISASSSFQIISTPRRRDLTPNIKVLKNKRDDMYASYLIEYVPKSKFITLSGDLIANSPEDYLKIQKEIEQALPKAAVKSFLKTFEAFSIQLQQLESFNTEGAYLPTYFIVIKNTNASTLAADIGEVEHYAERLNIKPNVLTGNSIWSFVHSYYSDEPTKLHIGEELHDVLPKSIEFFGNYYAVSVKSHEIVDGKYQTKKLYKKTINIKTLQAEATPYWLSDLFSLLGDHHIAYRTKNYSGAIATTHLNKSIRSKQTDRLSAKHASEIASSDRDIDALTRLIKMLAQGQMSLQSVVINVTVTGSSLNELRKKEREVVSKIRSRGMTVDRNTYRQFEAYNNAIPSSLHSIKGKDTVVIPSLATAIGFPFTAQTFQDKTSSISAVNPQGVPIMIDHLKIDGERVNNNGVIIGKSGGGKSFKAKKDFKDLITKGVRCFVIDPENEYQYLADSLGGVNMDMNDHVHNRINPLEVIKSMVEEDGEEKSFPVQQHLQFLELFLNQALPQGEELPIAQIRDAISSVYDKQKITNDKVNSGKIKSEDFPTLTDIHMFLIEKQKKLKDPTELEVNAKARLSLETLINNSQTSFLWNGHTNINIPDVPLVIFNINKLNPRDNKRVAGAQLMIIQKFIDSYVSSNKDKYQGNVDITAKALKEHQKAKSTILKDVFDNKDLKELIIKYEASSTSKEKLALKEDIEALETSLKDKSKDYSEWVDTLHKLSAQNKRALKLWEHRWVAIIIDEAHLIFDKDTKQALQFFYTMYKRIRKYHGSIWLITQSITDFMNPKIQTYTQGILNAATYVYAFGLNAGDITQLDKHFEASSPLTQQQKQFLNDANRGQVLIFIGSKQRLVAQIYQTPEEKGLLEGNDVSYIIDSINQSDIKLK